MAKIQIISDFGDGECYVSEETFWNTLLFVRDLIIDRNEALSSEDQAKLDALRIKEGSLLNRINSYEAERRTVKSTINKMYNN